MDRRIRKPFVVSSLVVASAYVASLLACGTAAPSEAGTSVVGTAPPASATPPGASDGPTTEGEPVPSFATVDAACEAYATALCDVERACGELAFRGRWSEVERCRTARAAECATRATGAAVDARAASACAAGAKASTCDDLDTRVLPAACDWRGPQGIDAPCSVGTQCQSGYCPWVQALECWTCREAAGVGEWCSDSTYCAPGLVCLIGACVAPARRGEACGPERPCGARHVSCSNGLCVPERPTVRLPGESCDPEAATGEEVCAGGRCTAARRCVLDGTEGTPCETPGECPAPFRCEDGRCAVPDPRKCQ